MKILLVIVAFMIILAAIKMFASRADVDSGLSICRGSVALQENSKIGGDVDIPLVTSGDFSYKLSPLLCKTYDLKLPENKYKRKLGETKEAVLKNIADRIADCWWEFGEGKINENVFGQQLFGFTSKNRCFNCFTFSINEMKDAQEIPVEELYDYMASHPYTAIADDEPFCGFKEGDFSGGGAGDEWSDGKIHKDCIDKNLPECERKGGICAEDYYIGEYTEFDSWSCPKKEKCFVNNENLLTYMEYIYYSGGKGLISAGDDLKKFTQDESYSIAFVSQTSDFGWQVAEIGALVFPYGKVLGAASKGVSAVSKILWRGAKIAESTGLNKYVIKGAPKMGDYIFNKAFKLSDAAEAVEKTGNTVAKVAAKTKAYEPLIKGGTELATGTTEYTKKEIDNFFSGKPQIVMIAPLSEINDICITQKEVGQK